jgi:hypothetical protein
MFFLPLRPDLTPVQREKIFDRVEPESFLFLRMRSLEVQDLRSGRRDARVWSKRCSPLSEGGEIELLEVDERRDDAEPKPAGMALRIEMGPIVVPRDDLTTLDHLVREALPDEVRVRIVSELDGDDLRDPSHDGSRLKGGLFNGLPVPGVATGLNLHVDAPFNLSADRTNILDDAFNDWLVRQIGEVASRFLARLRENDHFRNQVFRLVPADQSYGRKKGVGELTQRLARIHDRLREEARRIGVLPALDGEEPLRHEEALALRDADARKLEVARAVQSLIGGQPIATFAPVGTKIQAETIRLSRLPEATYEATVAKALGDVERFTPRWMRAALNDPEWRVRARTRDPQWYVEVFTYIGGGFVSDRLDEFLDIAWVPAFSTEEESIPPLDVTLLDNATAEDLAVVQDGLWAAGLAGDDRTWQFAHPDFLRAYQEATKSCDTQFEARRTERLRRLFAARLLRWEDVVDRLISRLEETSERSTLALPNETPSPVWKLIGLAARKGALAADAIKRLAGLTRVAVGFTGPPGTPTVVWQVTDVLLSPINELLPIPEQVDRRLPRLAVGESEDWLSVIALLAPSVPSPALVKSVLKATDSPSCDTVVWALKLSGLWDRARVKAAEIRSALGALRVAGKHSAEFHPLRSYCRDGFGKMGRGLEHGLTQLFGPKIPELRDYGDHLSEAERLQIQALMEEGPFLPRASELEHALKRLHGVGDDARRIALATDLAEFFGGVWDHYQYDRRHRGELPELLRLLRETRWIPATTRERWARPSELVLEERELLELFGDAVPAPLLPVGSKDRDRWVSALRVLGKKAELVFLGAEDSGSKAGQALADGLRSRFVGLDVFKRLELIGRFLGRHWFSETASALRQMIDLAAVNPHASTWPEPIGVICDSAEQEQNVKKEFSRGVAVVHHPNPIVRRALKWASGWMEVPKGRLLDCPIFSQQYILALGRVGTQPLDSRERLQVVQAYRTLARTCAGQSWFDLEDHAILTQSGTLVNVNTAVYSGDDPEIRSLLTKHLPGHCLVEAVGTLEPRVLSAILIGLRLDAREQQRRDDWIRERFVPRGDSKMLDLSPADRAHLGEVVRHFVPDVRPEIDVDQLSIRVVDQIDKRIELPLGGPSCFVVEPVSVYLQSRPPVLFLTDTGRVEFSQARLRLVNQAEYERQQRLMQSLRNDWSEAKARVEELAVEQKRDLLHNYRIAYSDPTFRKSDQTLDRQSKDLEQRWANFLAEPRRLAEVVKKHTTDIGYGKETVARELLQNVDDAYYNALPPDGRRPWAEFRQHDRALVVSHAGRRFSDQDLERICGLGGSGKSAQVQIGRFGLGFKSVLKVTAEPIILSHPYVFKINHVVVPEWIEPEGVRCRRWHDWLRDHALTRFVLEAASSQRDVEELIERLVKRDDLAPRVLLFLNHLSEITLHTADCSRQLTRTDYPTAQELLPSVGKTGQFDEINVQLRRLESREEGRRPTVEEFLVVEGCTTFRAPATADSQAQQLRCGIAFPWDSENERPGKPLEDSCLYLFLPTKTRTGLPFLLHGEFQTNLGRTDIDGDNETNQALARALAALVRSTLMAAFVRWRDNPEALRAVTRLAPWPGDSTQQASWLKPVREVFADLIKADKPVILTIDGTLVRCSECVFGQRLVRAIREPLLAADQSCSLKPVVDPEIEVEVRRAAGGAIRTLTGPELVGNQFPPGLTRAKAVLRVQAILRVLYEQEDDDPTQSTERYHALIQLSRVPCMPVERGGVARPLVLEHPDQPGLNHNPVHGADLAEVAGTDAKFRRWIIDSLRWAPPSMPTEPHDETAPRLVEVLVTSEDGDRLWAHNLRCISDWWSKLRTQGRKEIAEPYSLTGDRLWPILGLGDTPPAQRRDRLYTALREDDPDHERVWFRLLCLANIGQSGRRYEEGLEFLKKFDREFDGFERLWLAPEDGRTSDTVGDLIRKAVNAYIKQRQSAEQVSYWRRLYDFVKIRTLVRERDFLKGFWDAAEEHPAFLAQYLTRGQVPAGRFSHRGLGESLSSQAFFLCRECYCLQIIRGDAARENCYVPNRHLIRFVRDAFGPDRGDWPEFEDYEAMSHQLHQDVSRHTRTRDFDDAFDIPLLHLALSDRTASLVPGLVLRSNVEGVHKFLARGG